MSRDWIQPPQRDRFGRLRFHSTGDGGCRIDGNPGGMAELCMKCLEAAGDTTGRLLERLDSKAGAR